MKQYKKYITIVLIVLIILSVGFFIEYVVFNPYIEEVRLIVTDDEAGIATIYLDKKLLGNLTLTESGGEYYGGLNLKGVYRGMHNIEVIKGPKRFSTDINHYGFHEPLLTDKWLVDLSNMTFRIYE